MGRACKKQATKEKATYQKQKHTTRNLENKRPRGKILPTTTNNKQLIFMRVFPFSLHLTLYHFLFHILSLSLT